jgi:hypothetical protein
MDPLEAIRRAQATRLVGKNGHEVEFELAPALPPDDIEQLADEVGVPLSRELRALLERTAGIDGSSPVGMGFSWGRYGLRTDVRRQGHERLFAYAPLEKQPGLLRRLFA